MWPQTFPKSLLAGYAHHLLGETLAARLKFKTARAWLDQRIALNPDDVGLQSPLGIAQAYLGHRDEALRAARRASELYSLEYDAFYGQFIIVDLAWIHTILGDLEAGREQMDILLNGPSWVSVEWLRLDPRWGEYQASIWMG